MSGREADFYQRLRARIAAWGETDEARQSEWKSMLLLAPDLFHLLWKLTLDPRVGSGDKARLAAAVAYFISPIDLLPEVVLGPIGYLDDIALAAHVLSRVLVHTPEEVVREHWAGDGDVLDVIRRVVASADRMVGSGLWAKLRKRI